MNWSPRLGTAVSDLEVEYSEEPGHLYFFRCVCLRGGGERGEGRMLFCFGVRGFWGVFVRVRKGVTWSWSTTLRDSHAVCVCVCHSHLHRYPLADNPEEFLPVATTRPETILGDTAVAVHPEDERYKVRRAACCPRASYKGRV